MGGDLGEEASPGSFSSLRREGHRAQQAWRAANGLVKLAHRAAGRWQTGKEAEGEHRAADEDRSVS